MDGFGRGGEGYLDVARTRPEPPERIADEQMFDQILDVRRQEGGAPKLSLRMRGRSGGGNSGCDSAGGDRGRRIVARAAEPAAAIR